jgi:hypothetical protein
VLEHDMTDLFTGANPNLLYLGLALIVGGFVLRMVVRGVSASIIKGRIVTAMAPPKPDPAAPPPRKEKVVIGRRVYPAGGGPSVGGGLFGALGIGGNSEFDRKMAAQQKVIAESAGTMMMGNLLNYACNAIMLAGLVCEIVYLVQRYEVV